MCGGWERCCDGGGGGGELCDGGGGGGGSYVMGGGGEALHDGCNFAEPIQSRCAVLRYSKLSEAQILARIQEVCDKEKVQPDCTRDLTSLHTRRLVHNYL